MHVIYKLCPEEDFLEDFKTITFFLSPFWFIPSPVPYDTYVSYLFKQLSESKKCRL